MGTENAGEGTKGDEESGVRGLETPRVERCDEGELRQCVRERRMGCSANAKL